jgi:3-oxoadipate enol-lactonase
MPFAPVNDIKIYYETHGQKGTPLMMIQGYTANKVHWDTPHIERLASEHQVIIFDNRGAGQTDKPTTPYSMQQFAADTKGLLDHLDIKKAHVFGVSMGGMIAQHVALDYPDRVLGLVLGCTTATAPGNEHCISPTKEVFALLTKPSTGDQANDIRTKWSTIWADSFIENHRDFLEERVTRSLAYPDTPDYACKCQMHAIMKTHNTYNRLGQIIHPTLIQTGLKDVLVPPENSRVLAQYIPNAQLKEYPEAAHGYFAEAGTKAVEDLLDFLAETDSGS